VVLVIILIAPWYRLVPETLAQWRITGHWLDGRPSPLRMLVAPLTLAWNLFSGRGVWGGQVWPDRLAGVLVVAVGVSLLRRGPTALVGAGRDLLWLLVIAACVGPLVFDLLRGTLRPRRPARGAAAARDRARGAPPPQRRDRARPARAAVGAGSA
jgi:hypothetical protein